MQRSTSAKFWTFFCFQIVSFFASSWMKLYCYWTSCHVSFIWLPFFGNFRFFAPWISAYFHDGDLHCRVCLVYSFRSNTFFFLFYSATIKLLRKELSGTNLTQLKYDLSQNNWLVFVVFFIYNFHLSFTALHYLSHTKKLSDFFFFKLYFRYVFSLLFSSVFSDVIRYSKRIKILLFSVSFCPSKSIINLFLPVQFSRLLSRGKEKI